MTVLLATFLLSILSLSTSAPMAGSEILEGIEIGEMMDFGLVPNPLNTGNVRLMTVGYAGRKRTDGRIRILGKRNNLFLFLRNNLLSK